LLVLAVLAPTSTAAGPTLAVDWTRERLSVAAEEVPLADALREVARRTGLQVRGAEILADSVTIRFSGLPLSEALRRLLARVDHVLVEEMPAHADARPLLALFVGRRPFAGPGSSRPEGDEVATTEDAPGERLDRFLAASDPAVRRWAVERLGDVGDQWALSRVLAALRDQDAGVRESALGALGQYGPVAVESLTGLLERDTSPEVRAAALGVLGQVGGPVVAHWVRGMLDDPDPRIRLAAVKALGQAGGPDATEALRTAVADRDQGVRAAALGSLGFSGDDPQRSIEEGLLDGDEAIQAGAAALYETLSTRNVWGSAR
jgi:hypothetical protein